MSNLTSDLNRQISGDKMGYRAPLAASVIAFIGSLLSRNVSGYVNRLVAGEPFAGIALQRVEANDWTSAGAVDGNIFIQMACGRGQIVASIATASAVDAAKRRKVYASDDQVLTFTANGNTLIGEVIESLGGTLVLIEFITHEARSTFPGAAGVITLADAAVTVSIRDLDKNIHAPITAARTYTLPAAADCVGRFFTFINSGGNFALTIAAAGAEKIGGAATLVQTATTGRSTVLQSTGVAGAEWAIVANQ